MNRVDRVAFVLLLASALSGCTAAGTATTTTKTTSSTSSPSEAVVAAEAGADVGNDRPHVTYDGLMVRRRVVIAIHPSPDADLILLRKEMDKAAERRHTTLSSISPTVLDATLLERLSPELTLALPAGETLADARELIDPASSEGRLFPEVEEFNVASVLVHDLQFTVDSARPAVLAKAIAREGILSDALGNYTTNVSIGQLDIAYTGPLLSDELVESVRVGIARRAGAQPAAVAVAPRSTTGVGVDIANEPAPAVLVEEVPKAHRHGVGLPVALPAVSGSSRSSLWPLALVGGSVLLILTLVVVMLRRFKRADQT
ncbi:MAG: hypothetical protein ABIP19_06815 [Dermatophilaceae bacterium]